MIPATGFRFARLANAPEPQREAASYAGMPASMSGGAVLVLGAIVMVLRLTIVK
jgi:H+/Cl- antiporter ClcA